MIVEGDLPHKKKQKSAEQIAAKEKKGGFLSELEIPHDPWPAAARQLTESWLVEASV